MGNYWVVRIPFIVNPLVDPSTISIWPEPSQKEELKWHLYPVASQYQIQFPVQEEFQEDHFEGPSEIHLLRGPSQYEECRSLNL